MKLVLMAVLFSSMFSFSPSHVAMAADASMAPIEQETPAQELMQCEQNGCTQEHHGCAKHCLRSPVDHATVTMLPTTHTNQDLSAVSNKTVQFYQPIQTVGLVATDERAAPTHKLLRSVIKRE
ncbi:hypothetical protein GW777_00310 [Candidatus Peregrinibacteria bacterium]|nr:hypothetical protein [Candidatus Peregrinibacteria bacterium]